MRRPTRCVATVCLLFAATGSPAAERLRLDDANYDAVAPAGKEADAIVGDHVLRSDRLVAVIGAPGERRDANMTVRNVGGSVIDLTRRDRQSDQLSCLYPGGGGYRLTEVIDWPVDRPGDWPEPAAGAAAIAFAGRSISLGAGDEQGDVAIRVGYELRDGEDFLRLTTTLTNEGAEPVDVKVTDGVRADGEFKFGIDYDADLWWAYDRHWRQAYGLQPEGTERQVKRVFSRNRRLPRQAIYPIRGEDSAQVELAPGESITWRRRLFPARDNITLQSIAYRNRGVPLCDGEVVVTDGADPVEGAEVRVIITPPEGAPGERVSLGVGLTDAAGRYRFRLPAADYQARVSAQGHETQQLPISLRQGAAARLPVELSAPAYVEGVVTDGAGEPIPAKVQLIGLGDTRSPNFGPPSAIRGVKNLQYTPDGRFRAKLRPGRYRWLASYGPEHDAAEGEFEVAPRETATIRAALERTVDTTGWLSAELHSHSSPSGDNTASQRGRVLNLLAEQLEFCPCTEHQRIDVYDEHLEHFGATERMLTCPGLELTGQPLPLNHQNAFPLRYEPHQHHAQHGGAPATDPDPVKQIERLVKWDDHSEKLVQTNHPNVAQMVGDRDLDGEPDGGFEGMFGWMDVVEVHPPELIFEPLGEAGDPDSGVGNGGWDDRGAVITNWLQLLNLGYRLPGVVNTDAHYNHHGSGWLRNWVRCSTDDPTRASVAELVREFERGHVVMSNGPFLEVEATAGAAQAIPGDDLAAPAGRATFRVVVRCPNWLEVNRLQFFLNGRPAVGHNYTARTHPDWFAAGPEVLDREVTLDLAEDTHVVVAVCGEGRQLGALYGEKFGAVMPVAVANPIYVDTDGDTDGDGVAFEPNGDGLGLPLPVGPNHRPSKRHSHPH